MSMRRGVVGPRERALYLKSLPSWNSLSTAELAVVTDHVHEQFAANGTVLIEAGRPTKHAFLVVEGRVELRRAGQPDRVLGPRSRFGLLALLAQGPVAYDAVAAEDTLLLTLDYDSIRVIYEDSFVVFRADLARLAGLALDLARHVPTSPAILRPIDLPPTEVRAAFDLVDRVLLLRRAVPFRRSSPAAIGELALNLQEVQIPAGTRLWREGEAAPSLLVLIDGQIVGESDGQEPFSIDQPGTPFGFLEGLAVRPRWCTTTARTDLRVLRAETEGFLDVLEDNFETAFDYITSLATLDDALMTEAARLGVYGEIFRNDRSGPLGEYLPPNASGR